MRLSEGQTYVDPQNGLWVVTSLVPSANQITLRTHKGYTRTEALEEFRRMIVDGQYRLTSATDSSEVKAGPQELAPTPSQQKGLAHRKRIVDYITAQQAKGATWPEIESGLHRLAESIYGSIPGRRTLYRWMHANRRRQLVPGKRGWPRGRRRFAESISDALDVVIAELHANRTRELTNLETMRRLLNLELHRRSNGAHRGDAVSLKTLKEFLAVRAAWGEDLRGYLTKRAFRAITRIAGKIMDAERALEVVEIDAMIPEFHIFTPDGVDLGQPTIYNAVDVATGLCLFSKGYAMPPGVEPLLDFYQCLFFPKAPRADGWIPPWGRPERILTDLGPELRSSFSASVAYALLYEHLYAEGESGWKKPHVEGYNGTCKDMLLHRVAGSTKSARTKKVDPELATRTGGMTLARLNEVLEEFAWDIHACRTSDRLRIKFDDPDMTPRKAWDLLTAEYPPTLPVTREEFRNATFEFWAEARLGNHGVKLNHLEYHSRQLAELFMHVGPGPVEVYGTPLDVSQVIVKHPASGRSAQAESKLTEVRGIPTRVWKDRARALKLGRKSAGDHDVDLVLASLIHDLNEHPNRGSLTDKRNRAAEAQSMALAQSQEATQRSSPASRSPGTPGRVSSLPAHEGPRSATTPTEIVTFDPKAVFAMNRSK